MSSLRIRDILPTDAVQLGPLNVAFNGAEGTRGSEHLWSGKGQNEIVLVAEVEGELVGFACLQIMHSVCYRRTWTELTEIYVHPGGRRQGVGRALMQEAEKRAREHNSGQIHLRTNIKNQMAHALYVECGFQQSEDVVFVKRL
jgi:GNAT superfamily N-acetyltransferase